MENSNRDMEPKKVGGHKTDWKAVWRGVGIALLGAVCLFFIGLGLYLVALPYLYAHSRGYESRTEELAREKRAEIPKIVKRADEAVRSIKVAADKDVAQAVMPLERLSSEHKELEKRKRKADNRITARRFADEDGMRELAEDSMRLEKTIVEVTGHCRRIRLLHFALGKRKMFSKSIRESSASLQKLRDSHKRIMDDMEYASGINKAYGDR